jgi:SAM-dependent methyltransferase
LDWKKMKVDVHVSNADLNTMIRHVEATWEQLGRLEPHWSVLTDERFRAEAKGKNEAAFFASGEINAVTLRASAARYGIALEDYDSCFELGCGVGRITIWLARLFSHVVASDVSAPHLELAREALSKYACHNVELSKLGSLEDLENLPEFDAFFSQIVLQHNPPPVMAYMLKTVLLKLRPGGIGYFQLPTYILGYRFSALDYLSQLTHTGRMEMHVLPQDVLFDLIEKSGCQLLEVREDNKAGIAKGVSNTVLIRKRRSWRRSSRL